MTGRPIIAVPIGDPNGIGPEIAAAAARADGPARLLLVGSPLVIEHHAGGATVRLVDATNLPAPAEATIDVVAVDAFAANNFLPGQCGAASGRATVAYAAKALDLAKGGHVQAVAACPHNETAINAAGIPFSGYPSLVARLCSLREDEVFLMLVGGGLRIVHATLHERLADALARIDTALIERAAVAARDAVVALGVDRPRIGLFGINPHAGENGLFGDDDDRATVPAAQALRARGLDVAGPAGADLLLSEGACDVYVAAFHDQGHIPIKLLAGRDSAAMTIGAGILFASVGHGSAPDIAGKGIADPAPLMRTIRLLSGASQ
ncbi:MAG: 4-hydroxythreonine-4-phosphate dehydrogenase [Sphingomonas bacterium]|nr:4-hydroxythreonine-4-phosphate dehydrogenase PdxA [Sphingomonas bacterium]MDB5688818.1 4-hydroxythreonine-4-phosphate dehydrogenase [Sphingomonas bacterium]